MENEGQKGMGILVIGLIVALLGMFFYFYIAHPNFDNRLFKMQLTTKDQTSENPTSEAQINITKEGFVPATLVVAKGQQVTWINQNGESHQLIAWNANTNSTQFDSEILGPNDTFSYTFDRGGKISYRDGLNLNRFAGEIVVK